MRITRRAATLGGLSLLAGTSVSTVSRAELGSFLGIGEGIEDFILATDAYIYGYPLVTMEMTRRVITNVAAPVGTRGPMGQIIKLRQYPDASFRDITAPNADTLYTTAFFDVGSPAQLRLPRQQVVEVAPPSRGVLALAEAFCLGRIQHLFNPPAHA